MLLNFLKVALLDPRLGRVWIAFSTLALSVYLSVDSVFNTCVERLCLSVGLVYYLQNLQTSFLTKFLLKISLTALFIHIKIILLQCFQFLAINDIQTDP